MKKPVLILMINVLSFTLVGQAQNGASTTPGANEKQVLLDYFEQTSNELATAVWGLSEAQMQYKPGADQWSVSQVLEHILLTEKMLYTMVSEQMKAPSNPERRAEVKVSDEDLINGMTDRSNKFKTSKDLEGTGEYVDPQEAIDDLKAQRQLVIALIEKTPLEELRNRVSDTPMGAVDAYQSLLFLAGHTARHRLQIEEIKADEGFPDTQN